MLKMLCSLSVNTCLLCIRVCPSPQAGFDGKSWWEDVKYFADDKLEGRETGSPGCTRLRNT